MIVTRPWEQSSGFVGMLEDAGAEVVLAPMIRVVPPLDGAPLEAAARDLGGYDWLVFTSVNGVESFWAAVQGAGTKSAWARASICAIGPITAEAVESRGGRVALVASIYTAEGVTQALSQGVDLAGKRILLPQAAGAREILSRTLSELGAEVTQVEAYRTIENPDGMRERELKAVIREGDMVTFTSASSVRAFVQSAGAFTAALKIATIGPITSSEVRESGFGVDVEGDPHTIEGLMAAILRYFTSARE